MLSGEALPSNWAVAPLDVCCDINPPTDISAIEPDTQVTFVPMAAVGAMTNVIDTSTNRLLKSCH